MPDQKFACNSGVPGSFKEACCIDAGRIYDSCCDRDCLEDLRVYFTEENQELLQHAIAAKVKCAEILRTYIDVEPVTFNRGFYSCDITFFFLLKVEVICSPNTAPVCINGISVFDKKVILYGSEGSVQTFCSTMKEDDPDPQFSSNNQPKCCVQVVDPVVLDSQLCEIRNSCDLSCHLPSCVMRSLGGDICTRSGFSKGLYVTLGVFSIVQLIRNVQMLIPVYDFCIPQKECSCNNDSPCEMFDRIKFPTEEFFPPKLKKTDQSCCNSCCNN